MDILSKNWVLLKIDGKELQEAGFAFADYLSVLDWKNWLCNELAGWRS
jgi:hypothetical protein